MTGRAVSEQTYPEDDFSDHVFFWRQSSDYWDLPFFSEFGLSPLLDFEDTCAAREQLWATRELMDEGDSAPDVLG